MKKFFIISLMVFMFMFGACGVQPSKAQNSTSVGKTNFGTCSDATLIQDHQDLAIQEFIDQDTGVHYIIVSSDIDGYAHGNTIAITPRLKADGKLYTSWKGKGK